MYTLFPSYRISIFSHLVNVVALLGKVRLQSLLVTKRVKNVFPEHEENGYGWLLLSLMLTKYESYCAHYSSETTIFKLIFSNGYWK